MKALLNVGTGLALLLIAGSSFAQSGPMQSGPMMHDGMWGSGWMGGYGGFWVPLVVLATIVGLVVWVVKQQKK
ncbi:MAG: hypothetical protein LJE84_06160 [Gammaproteobacteria bacterium]|nr:hypothetical protein [Gammaproteobacteria bacterium]